MRKLLLTTFLITALSSSVMAQVSVMSEEGIKPSQPKPLVLKQNSNNSNNTTNTTGPNKYDCDSTCMNMQAQNNVNRSYVENRVVNCPAGYTGSKTERRNNIYNQNGYQMGAWTTIKDTCAPPPSSGGGVYYACAMTQVYGFENILYCFDPYGHPYGLHPKF